MIAYLRPCSKIILSLGTYDFLAFNYYTARTVRKAKDGEKIGHFPLEGNYDFDLMFSVRPDWKNGADWFYVRINCRICYINIEVVSA